jgi:hypothetical protein
MAGNKPLAAELRGGGTGHRSQGLKRQAERRPDVPLQAFLLTYLQLFYMFGHFFTRYFFTYAWILTI